MGNEIPGGMGKKSKRDAILLHPEWLLYSDGKQCETIFCCCGGKVTEFLT